MTGNFLIQCKTRKMEVLQFLAVAFGSYVFGIIVMMIIRANTMEENECVTLGMLIAMAALVFVHFFGIIFSFVGEFNMAISMGATRRAYVGSYALFNMAELAGLELLLFVLGKIESALMRVIYPQCVSGCRWSHSCSHYGSAGVEFPEKTECNGVRMSELER